MRTGQGSRARACAVADALQRVDEGAADARSGRGGTQCAACSCVVGRGATGASPTFGVRGVGSSDWAGLPAVSLHQPCQGILTS